MADDILLQQAMASATASAQSSQTASSTRQSALDSNAEVSQQEFLMLLVNQLQNQDPLNPMENEEFAVQLAQFSQVEQLISINDKMGELSGQGANVGMLAAFLGHEVVLNNQTAQFGGSSAPNAVVQVPEGAVSGRVDFIDASGKVAGSANIETLEAGQQIISLQGAPVSPGAYSVQVKAVGPNGEFMDLDTKLTGTVEGFVMEPEAGLIVNGENVALADVVEVYTGK